MHKFYILQYRQDNKPWTDAGEGLKFQALVPFVIRFETTPKQTEYRIPFKDFSEEGLCYKNTGYHGTYVLENAKHFLKMISGYNPSYKFRLVKVTLTPLPR